MNLPSIITWLENQVNGSLSVEAHLLFFQWKLTYFGDSSIRCFHDDSFTWFSVNKMAKVLTGIFLIENQLPFQRLKNKKLKSWKEGLPAWKMKPLKGMVRHSVTNERASIIQC